MASNVNPQPQPDQKPSGEPSVLCIFCKAKPQDDARIDCIICGATWHVTCLVSLRESLAFTDTDWGCPECNNINLTKEEGGGVAADEITVTIGGPSSSPSSSSGNSMVAKILAIQADESLTEEEKARKRQELLSSGSAVEGAEKEGGGEKKGKGKGKEKMVEHECDALKVSDNEMLNCSICLNMLDRPVTVKL